MASTIQITVLVCAACGKLENTQDIYETTGASIPTLLWARHGTAYGFADLWLCGKCLTRSLGALLEAVQTRQEAEHEDAEEAARQTRAQERHYLEGWYYVEGRKARVHYYRDNRSLCHKLYATSLWGAVTGFTEIPRGFTGTLCPGCATALNAEEGLRAADDISAQVARQDALRAEDAAKLAMTEVVHCPACSHTLRIHGVTGCSFYGCPCQRANMETGS